MDFVSVIMKAHEDDYNDNFDHWHWLFPKSGSNKALSVYFKKGSDGFDTRIQPTHLRVDMYLFLTTLGIRITLEVIWQEKTGHIVQPGAYTEGGGEEIRRRMARCEQQ